MKYFCIKTCLILFGLVIILSCENPLEDRVTDLENKLKQQENDWNAQQAILDSLVLVVQEQNALINTMIVENQRILDSLILSYNQTFDSLSASQTAYIDSLINVQQEKVDSMYAYQQNLINDILESQINAGFTETEIFNGNCPSTWTDLDIRSIVGEKRSLVILRIDKLSGDLIFAGFRPNGETVDWLSEDPNSYQIPSNSLSIIALGLNSSGLAMIFTDENGIIEFRSDNHKTGEVNIKLEYFIN